VRSFVSFVLEPYYKLVSAVISEEKNELKPLLMQENILLTKKEYSLDIRPLLKLIMSKIFGSTCCLVDSLTEFIKPCKETMKLNLSNNLLASKNIVEKFSESNKDAPLLAHICKLYHSETALSFYALTKVYSGTIKEG